MGYSILYPNHSFPKSKRIQTSKTFKDVLGEGQKKVLHTFVLFYKKNDELTKVGFVTGKKLGNAVIRNRIRRRIKESYRLNQNLLNNPHLLVFLGRKNALEASWEMIDKEMKQSLEEIENQT